MMDYKIILFEEKNGVGTLTLNDPANQNTMSFNTMDKEIIHCLNECETNSNVRAIIINGSGEYFSAGASISGMKNANDHPGTFDYNISAKEMGRMILTIREIRKPVIASIHGACIGGGLAIALACDFRISTEDCKIIAAFANVGLVPDMGASLILSKILGPARAADLIMTAKPISGKKAFEWGLVNQAVPADKLEETTMRLANKLANGPGLIYGGTKELINNISNVGLKHQINFEGKLQYRLSFSKDHYESISAFLEKRKPVFKGC